MARGDNHLLTGIAKYLDCKEPLTVSKGYYCCIGRRKQRCDKRFECKEPFVPEKKLDGQIEWTVERFQLPQFAAERLLYEADKADQEFIKEKQGLIAPLTAELLEIADGLNRLGVVSTKQKRINAEELTESSKVKIGELLHIQNERLCYFWIKAIAVHLGQPLVELMDSPWRFRTLLTELFEAIYVKSCDVARFKLSPIYDYALAWVLQNCGYINPCFHAELQEHEKLSMRDYAKHLVASGHSMSSSLINSPTIQHQRRLELQEHERRKVSDVDVFLEHRVVSNLTFNDVKRELERRHRAKPLDIRLGAALLKLNSMQPNVDKMPRYRYRFYADLIREYANTLDFEVLEILMFDKPAYVVELVRGNQVLRLSSHPSEAMIVKPDPNASRTSCFS